MPRSTRAFSSARQPPRTAPHGRVRRPGRARCPGSRGVSWRLVSATATSRPGSGKVSGSTQHATTAPPTTLTSQSGSRFLSEEEAAQPVSPDFSRTDLAQAQVECRRMVFVERTIFAGRVGSAGRGPNALHPSGRAGPGGFPASKEIGLVHSGGLRPVEDRSAHNPDHLAEPDGGPPREDKGFSSSEASSIARLMSSSLSANRRS